MKSGLKTFRLAPLLDREHAGCFARDLVWYNMTAVFRAFGQLLPEQQEILNSYDDSGGVKMGVQMCVSAQGLRDAYTNMLNGTPLWEQAERMPMLEQFCREQAEQAGRSSGSAGLGIRSQAGRRPASPAPARGVYDGGISYESRRPKAVAPAGRGQGKSQYAKVGEPRSDWSAWHPTVRPAEVPRDPPPASHAKRGKGGQEKGRSSTPGKGPGQDNDAASNPRPPWARSRSARSRGVWQPKAGQ